MQFQGTNTPAYKYASRFDSKEERSNNIICLLTHHQRNKLNY